MRHLAAALFALACASAQAQWSYATKKDPMTDAVTTQASLKSAPRAGAELVAYRAGGQWNGVRLIVSRGQLLSSEGIVLRLDDDTPMQLRAVGAADGSAHFLSIAQVEFMEHPDLVERIAHAQRLRVQATLYSGGEQVFEFKPAGLKLD